MQILNINDTMSIVAPRESPFKPLSKTYPDRVSNGDGSISVDDTVQREDLRQKFYQRGAFVVQMLRFLLVLVEWLLFD